MFLSQFLEERTDSGGRTGPNRDDDNAELNNPDPLTAEVEKRCRHSAKCSCCQSKLRSTVLLFLGCC